jgi:cbb3-type cytochrome oxidase subunit 3
VLGQVGLIAFFVAFTAIVIYVLRMRKSDRTAAKNLPLEDDLDPRTLTNQTRYN